MNTLTNIQIGHKLLITTDNWFCAPNGRQYKAVFGTVKAVRTAEETLGVRPNGRSTNWYVEIGNMVIAGCQVHYAIRSDKCSFERAIDYMSSSEKGAVEFERPSHIYNADEGEQP